MADTAPNSNAGTPSKLTLPKTDAATAASKMSKTASTASLDMFAEHADIFNDQFDSPSMAARRTAQETFSQISNPLLTDNWDDPEGYYSKSRSFPPPVV